MVREGGVTWYCGVAGRYRLMRAPRDSAKDASGEAIFDLDVDRALFLSGDDSARIPEEANASGA